MAENDPQPYEENWSKSSSDTVSANVSGKSKAGLIYSQMSKYLFKIS